MDWKRLFDFRGRAKRSEYWLLTIGIWIALAVLLLVSILLRAVIGVVASLFMAPAVLIGVAAIVAVSVRRLHDRGKSGWWLLLLGVLPGLLSGIAEVMTASGDPDAAAGSLVFSVPSFALSIWSLIELGMLPARKGPNKYAPPQAPEVAEAFS